MNSNETYLSYQKVLEFVGDSSNYQKNLSIYFCVQQLLNGFMIMALPLFTLPENYACEFEGKTIVCSYFYAQTQHLDDA